MTPLLKRLYVKYMLPKSADESIARHEFIFNVLLLGMLALTLATFLVSLSRSILQVSSPENLPPVSLLLPILLLLFLYCQSRKKFHTWHTYVLIALYYFMGTMGLHLFSYILPQGLLIYALVIVISGILISARASLIVTLIIGLSMCLLWFLQVNQITHPYTSELNDPMRTDLIVYLFIFFTIYLVSWLSSREIERSLEKAKKSEKMLLKEKDMLEIKVQERTRQVEKAQLEKMQEIYRFAEFGRQSSSLLHDIADPLTAVSLNLNQLESKKKPRVLRQIKQGISHMEDYVRSARSQLNNQSESTIFDSRLKILQVVSILQLKAKSSNVKIKLKIAHDGFLYGDSSKFSQVIANLLTNAIDSFGVTKTSKKYQIKINTKTSEGKLSLEISDNGRGILAKDLKKIFEPFFTTKPNDQGTGIGLTITRRIIEEEFSGTIDVKSTDKKGTVFKVSLPLYKDKN